MERRQGAGSGEPARRPASTSLVAGSGPGAGPGWGGARAGGGAGPGRGRGRGRPGASRRERAGTRPGAPGCFRTWGTFSEHVRKGQQCLWKICLTALASYPPPYLTAVSPGPSPPSMAVPAAGHRLAGNLPRAAPPSASGARSPPAGGLVTSLRPRLRAALQAGGGARGKGRASRRRAGGGAAGPVRSCDLRADLPERWVP